jgi:hypothetical protein
MLISTGVPTTAVPTTGVPTHQQHSAVITFSTLLHFSPDPVLLQFV